MLDCKKMKRNSIDNKGITLIALVITIIVLLILAGVSIATLTGDNGILTQSSKAKEETTKAGVQEKVALEVMGSRDEAGINLDTLNKNLKDRGYITKDITELPTNIEMEDYVVFINKDGTVVAEKGKFVDGVYVPEGFYYLEGDKKTGLVISDIENDKENKGNQFVFVPVDNPSEMYGIDKDGKKWGKLYNFTQTGYTANNWTETNGVMNISSTTSWREPDCLTDTTDGDASPSNTIGLTKESLEQEFNKMIESVIRYKGFYIGRYELSLDANKNAQSKKGKISSDASQIDTKMWYGLYAKAKTYTNSNNINIKSSMIWGCQYDAMLRWMQGNGIDVTSETITQKNTSRITGSVETDKLNKIYDILGNSWEWTLEANFSYTRVYRAGYFNGSVSPGYRSNYGGSPTYTGSNFCSRLMLY